MGSLAGKVIVDTPEAKTSAKDVMVNAGIAKDPVPADAETDGAGNFLAKHKKVIIGIVVVAALAIAAFLYFRGKGK